MSLAGDLISKKSRVEIFQPSHRVYVEPTRGNLNFREARSTTAERRRSNPTALEL